MEKQTVGDEVKVFLKLKKVMFSDDKPYFKIHEKKQTLILFDPLRKVDSDKSLIFELDKIFTDEENAYIYEEVCRDTICEAFNRTNFCFIAYGLGHTGRKTLLMGGTDSISNINSRGLFFRLLENIINKVNLERTDFSLNISYAAVHGNKYMDMSNFLSKKNLEVSSENQLFSYFKDIKKSSDFSSILKKVPVSDVNEIIHFYSQVMSIFYKAEAFERKLYSRTNFIFIISLVNNSGEIFSNITFNLLEGSEKLTTGDNLNDVLKIKGSIMKENIFDNLLNCITILKNPDFKTFQEVPFDDSPFTTFLQSFIKNNSTKFRIVGCTQPNTGYHECVKDTLMFLFRCKKSIYDKSSKKQNLKSSEIKRDEVLYELENKIKSQEKNIVKLNETINNLQKKLEQTEISYKKNLETVKLAFAFEGDINKLEINDDYTKEAKYARKMRDSNDMVKLLNKKISELEKKIEEFKDENKKLQLEKRIVENNQMMFNLYTRLKEDNLHEENKIKIMLEHNNQLEVLKSQNENLDKRIESYKKEIDEKSKFIHNLPNLLKDNIEDRKNFGHKKSEMKNDLEKKFQKIFKETQTNFRTELKITSQTYEGIINHKNEEIEANKRELVSCKNKMEYEVKEYTEELVKVYQILQNLLENYKKKFDKRRLGANANSITSFTNFLKAKDSFDKTCNLCSESLSRINYPLLFKSLDNRRGSLDKNEKILPVALTPLTPIVCSNLEGKFQHIPQKLTPIKRSFEDFSCSASDISIEVESNKPKKVYIEEELADLDKIDLMRIIFDIQKKFINLDNFFIKLKKEKRGFSENVNNKKSSDEDIVNMFKENEKIKKKLAEQIKSNNAFRMTIQSQERMIEKIKGNKFLEKNVTERNSSNVASNIISAISSPKHLVNTQRQNSSYKLRPQTGNLKKIVI